MSLVRLRRPRKPFQGATIMVVELSNSYVAIEKARLERAQRCLEASGFKVVLAPGVGEGEAKPLSHLDVDHRIRGLHHAFQDPEVDIILVVIGGASCNELLRHINWELIQNNPKPFFGFSDIATFINAMFAMIGIPGFYGVNLSNFGETQGIEYTMKNFMDMLYGEEWIRMEQPPFLVDKPFDGDGAGTRDKIINPGWTVIQPGTFEGTQIGGNGLALSNLVGSKFCPPIGKNLLDFEVSGNLDREDVNAQLQRFFILEPTDWPGAINLGKFQTTSDMHPAAVKELLKRKKGFPTEIPIVLGTPFGHRGPHGILIIGGQARLTAKGDKNVVFEQLVPWAG